MRASSEGLSATVRALVPIGQDYGVWPVGIHWISHTVMVTQQHCMSRLSRVFDSPASSAASASTARVPGDRANPMRWTLSRAPAWASSEVASLRPRRTRAAGPWGRPWPPPECARRGHSGEHAGRLARTRPHPLSPPPVAPAEVAAGQGTESWNPRNLGVCHARQDPRFPDSQLADSRSAPATAPAGLRLADAVIALASRPCPNSRRQPPRRPVKRA